MNDLSPVPTPSRRWPARTVTLVAFALLVVLAGTVGTGVWFEHMSADATAAADDRRDAATKRLAARQVAEDRRLAKAARQRHEDRYAACVREWTPVLTDLSTVDSRLDVRITRDSYAGLLGDASLSYDRVDVNDVSDECIRSVDGPLNKALNEYIRAGGRWSDCLSLDDDCSLSDIEPTLQKSWSTASTLVGRAQERLDGMAPRTGSQT